MKFSLALVTGASSGIGYALCKLLAEKGVDLIITGRDATKLEELAKTLKNKVSVQAIQADLANKEQRAHVVQVIRQRAPDLIVNNAGFGLYLEATSHEVEKQLEILEINGTALLDLTLEAAIALKSVNKPGVIMNVSSVASFFVFPLFAVYTASKSFVRELSQSLDYELKPDGIRVLVCCPGVVNTAFRERSGGKYIEDPSGTMTAEYAANEIWWQIQKQKQLHIFNWKYRLAVCLSKFVPESLLVKVLQTNIKNRGK